MAEAEERVLAYIREYVPEPRRAPLAGNTIGTDRAFLARDMPTLEAHVHYRNVDVSSIKELARRWYPRAYYNTPAKNGNHRALADIQESIEELRYYREALFVPPPGLADGFPSRARRQTPGFTDRAHHRTVARLSCGRLIVVAGVVVAGSSWFNRQGRLYEAKSSRA